jgi:hypothetical protein
LRRTYDPKSRDKNKDVDKWVWTPLTLAAEEGRGVVENLLLATNDFEF